MIHDYFKLLREVKHCLSVHCVLPCRCYVQRNILKLSFLGLGAVTAVATTLFLTTGLLQAQTSPRAATLEVSAGDLVFQESKGRRGSASSQAGAIKEVTGSRYTHCGIVVKRDGKLFVAEAISPVRVTATPQYPLRTIEAWIASGVDRHAVIKRIRGGLSPARLQQLEQSMRRFQSKPYDVLFQWSDEKIYCSEFIYDSFNDQTLDESQRILIGRVQTFSVLPMSGPLATNLIKQRYTDAGKRLDPEEKIITPVAVLNDPNLDTVAIVDQGRLQAPSAAQ